MTSGVTSVDVNRACPRGDMGAVTIVSHPPRGIERVLTVHDRTRLIGELCTGFHLSSDPTTHGVETSKSVDF